MVSQAGALALGGMLPAVHSFACFLTPRANEQIFNNATEGTKVIYARLPGRDRARRPGPLAPVRPRHRADGQRARAWRAWSPPRRPRRARCVELGGATRPTGPVYLRFVSRAVGARLRAAAPPAPLVPRPRHGGARRAATCVHRLHRPGAALPGGRRGRARSATSRWSRCRGCATSTARGWPRSAGGAPDRRARQPRRRAAARATPCAPRCPARHVDDLGGRRRAGVRHQRRGAARARPRRRLARRPAGGAVTLYLFWDIDGTLLPTARAGRLRAGGGGEEVLGAPRRPRDDADRGPDRRRDRASTIVRGLRRRRPGARRPPAAPPTSGCCPSGSAWRAGPRAAERAREPRGARPAATTWSTCC